MQRWCSKSTTRAIPASKHHKCHSKFNKKETPVDTGQGHPDQSTGHRSEDYLQNKFHFCWNGPRRGGRGRRERKGKDPFLQ